MEFQLSYFKSWKMMLESATLNMPANLESSAVATRLELVSFHSNPKERQFQRLLKPWMIAFISHTSKVMFKILQARLQQYWTVNLQMFKMDLEKAEEPEIKLPISFRSLKKQESSRKNIYFCFIDYAKNFVWITINCGKFWKRWESHTSWLEKSVCRSGSNS